jgi:hypothetical protein
MWKGDERRDLIAVPQEGHPATYREDFGTSLLDYLADRTQQN